MSVFTEGGLRIEFPDGLSVRKFDDPKTHGRPHMRAVDFIVDLPDRSLFIEVKEPEGKSSLENMRGLSRKFRDSFLYEWAEGRADKRIDYIVLLVADGLTSAELEPRTDDLRRRLPAQGPFNRPWKRPLVANCLVMDLAAWNQNALTRKFPAARVS